MNCSSFVMPVSACLIFCPRWNNKRLCVIHSFQRIIFGARCGFRVGSRWASLTIMLVHNCMRGAIGSGPLPVPNPTISSCTAVNTQAIDWSFISDFCVSICVCYFCVHVCPRPSNGKGLLEFCGSDPEGVQSCNCGKWERPLSQPSVHHHGRYSTLQPIRDN